MSSKLDPQIKKLNGIVMIFVKNNQVFKVYKSVEQSKKDKKLNNPINVSDFGFDLLKKLLFCNEPNVRYNSSRIIEAKISNVDFTEEEKKAIIESAQIQLNVEENLRVKALISYVLKNLLDISKE